MEKERAIELLIQAVDEIPHLKTLHYQNDEIKLWLDKVGNILRAGLKPEDYSKYWPVSQALEILKGVYEDNIYQEEYLKKVTNYEIALKSILLKYEVVGMEGKRDKGGEVEKKWIRNEKQEMVSELKDFHKELKSYKRLLERNKQPTPAQKRYIDSLRERLVYKTGKLKLTIIQLTSKQYYIQFGQSHEFWADGLSSSGYLPAILTSLGFCIDATNEAIGKLESTPVAELKLQEVSVKDLPRDAKDYGGRIVDKAFEFTVQGTPDMILECIRSTTEKLNSQGYTYSFRRTSGAPDYAKWDKTYFASCAISQGDEGQIGTISFQLIPNDGTLLKSTQPESWNPSFQYFMNYLLAEFQRLEFADSKAEKPAATAKAQKDTGEVLSYLFDNMQFHPRIIRASKSLFNSGHYAEAIFAAFKSVNNFIKRKTGLQLDGKDLMTKAFNEDKPIIKLNKLKTQSERNEQEGFRFLYMGAMVGIRNPKAHEDIRQIDPYKALEYLAFASLLMRRAIEGKLDLEE